MKCGVVDVGSNTIRLSIYHCEGKRFKLLMNKKEMAGLASYIRRGAMSEGGIWVACRVLAGFREIVNNLGIQEFHVFGTAPLRNISNTEEAVDTIRTATGIQVDVLSGVQEANYSFLGALAGGNAPASGLLSDIGGGSTELVAYQDGVISSQCSLPIGSLSLYTNYVSGLFPSHQELRSLRVQIRHEIGRAKTAGLTCSHLTGVGGTIRAAAKLCNHRAKADPGNRLIPAGEIRALYKDLKKCNQATLHQILEIVPDRVHTVLPGLAILKTVLDIYEVETISVSTTGVREGYLLDRVLGGDEQ